MTTVNAAIEQISSGQIGHPAACIIESNRALSCGCPGSDASPLRADYGVAKGRDRCSTPAIAAAVRTTFPGLRQPSTRAVENFVDNLRRTRPKTSSDAVWNRLLKD